MELRPKSRRDPGKGRQQKVRKKKGGKVVKITKEGRGKERLKKRDVEDDKGRQGTLVQFRKEKGREERRREEKRREVKGEKKEEEKKEEEKKKDEKKEEEKMRRKKKKRKKIRRKKKRRKR